MNSNTTHFDIENIRIFCDPTQPSRILAAYLYMYKAHTDYSWEKIATILLTTRKTLYNIRKAEKPILMTTFYDLLNRIMVIVNSDPKDHVTKKDNGRHCYKCHPDCPFIADYQREKASEDLLKGLLKDLLNIIK